MGGWLPKQLGDEKLASKTGGRLDPKTGESWEVEIPATHPHKSARKT